MKRSDNMKHLPITISVFLLAASFQTVAQDDVHPELDAEYSLDMGLLFPQRDIKFRAGVALPGARNVDFSSEFGLKKHEQTFAIDFRWRFTDEWLLSVQHFQVSARATAALEEDIEWNNLVFSRGTNVEASSGFSLYRLFFGHSFAKAENVDFGIGGGFHWLDMSAEIAGSILVNNTVTFRRENVKTSAPLPNIGGWYNYSLSPRWAIKARADWFKASVDDYDGRLVNFQAGVNYAWFNHGGIGLSYNYFEFDAGINASRWQGAADLTYKGPFAFFNFYW